MTEAEKKQRVLDIYSEGIAILSADPKNKQLVMICRSLRAKIANGTSAVPDLDDLQAFFEMNMFIQTELIIIKKAIMLSKGNGIKLAHFGNYLPNYATDRTPDILFKLLDADDQFEIRYKTVYSKPFAPKVAETVGAGKTKKSSSLNKNPAAGSLKTSLDKATFSKAYSRLLKRIDRDFDKKFFIGDIVISDLEYEILCEYLKNKCNIIMQSRSELTDCPVFAVALVQVGIRKYSSNRFWPFVEEATGLKIQGTDQALIGASFVNTLKAHDKYIVSETERVSSILVHTFVSNFYSRGLFELLFQYYVNDLERDIYRNTSEQMKALMDTLETKSLLSEAEGEAFTDQFMEKGSRAYKLKQHTLQAISAYQSHSTMRLRRFIRLIDKAFWKDSVPKNPTSRLTILFKEWVAESEAFKHEYKEYKIGNIRNRGKKHFSAPYIYADIPNSLFSLKLPAQIVREEYTKGLTWRVTTVSHEWYFPANSYPVLTGFKTEEQSVSLTSDELFYKISCELVCGKVSVRKFGDLEESKVRFFDMEGDYAPRLFRIPMCAYTPMDVELKSPAAVDRFGTKGMMRWDFEFENGDIVFLPEGKSMIVGEKYSDGLAPRGKVNDCVYRENGQDSAVYSVLPNLVLTIPINKIQGTELSVNGERYRLGDCNYIEFEAGDAKGARAFYLETAQFREIMNNSLNTLILDVPGNRFAQYYQFVYIHGLKSEFADAPYIFEETGTLSFSGISSFTCVNEGVKKLYGGNGLQFPLTPELSELDILFNDKLLLHFFVPVFMWSKDNRVWHTEPMGEVWHSEFFGIKKLFVRSPSWVEISTDDDEDSEEDLDEKHAVTAERRDGDFRVDMTRFKTWINRDKLKYSVRVKTGGKSSKLADVYSKSFAVSCELNADYEERRLFCRCEIIGLSEHFADIIHLKSGKYIASKVRLENGEAVIDCALENGEYRLVLFESDDEDDGFGDIEYLPFYEYKTSLINRNDFSGQRLRILKCVAKSRPQYYQHTAGNAYVTQLKKTGKYEYDGFLTVFGTATGIKTHVIFSENEENRSFVLRFDEAGHKASEAVDAGTAQVRDEDEESREITDREKNRRIKMLFSSDYIFYGVLEEGIQDNSQNNSDGDEDHVGVFNAEKAEWNPLSLTIEELGLTRETYNALKAANVEKVFNLICMTEQQLRTAGRFKNRNIAEIREVLKKVGKDFRK